MNMQARSGGHTVRSLRPSCNPARTTPRLAAKVERFHHTLKKWLTNHPSTAGTPVALIIADLDIRVVATNTGEPLRHRTLDPTHCS